jgi:hypothetical protein
MRYGVMVPVVVATAVWVVTTPGAQAQTAASTTTEDVVRAVDLERQAEIAHGDRRSWREAASLLVEASRLRRVNDPIALADLRTAGAIYGEVGQPQRGKRILLELADTAIEFGEVATAAHALIDAAHLAAESSDANGARSAFGRAQRLAMSSHLTGEQQHAVASRLERMPGVFASAPR